MITKDNNVNDWSQTFEDLDERMLDYIKITSSYICLMNYLRCSYQWCCLLWWLSDDFVLVFNYYKKLSFNSTDNECNIQSLMCETY